MEHTGKLRDNCEKRKVQLQKCGRFCKSRWNTGTAASPLKWKQNSPERAKGSEGAVRTKGGVRPLKEVAAPGKCV